MQSSEYLIEVSWNEPDRSPWFRGYLYHNGNYAWECTSDTVRGLREEVNTFLGFPKILSCNPVVIEWGPEPRPTVWIGITDVGYYLP